MKHRGPTKNALVVLLAFLLLWIEDVCAGVVVRSPTKSSKYPKLIEATIETLQTGLENGDFTSVDLVRTYIARIAEVNDMVNAINEINPDAIAIATKLDAERMSGSIRGPLHGIPILIKDTIATNDLMNNTAGSYALLGARVARDSTVVQKLRAAGAILLGKTNLSQWANFRSFNSSNGWSSIGGQSLGPYFPNEDPWGSSSGSAISSTLGLAAGSLGTETDGSITYPASFNNIVGIKPTVGLTSRYLVVPVSEHQDTIGPLTRTVKDAAYILHAIAGVDSYDNYTSVIPNGTIPNYVDACSLSGLSGMRLGVPRNALMPSDNTTGPILAAFEKALDVLRTAGAIIVEDTNFTAATEFRASTSPTAVVVADFLVNLKSYFDELTYNPNNITSLAVLRNFTQTSNLEDYPDRDTGLWDLCLQQNWNNTDPRFWEAYKEVLYFGGEGGLLGVIERDKLDAIVLPAQFATDWAAGIGSPIFTVPMGFYPFDTPIIKNARGLVEAAPNVPFGLSFLGARFTETKLFGMAYAYEQSTMTRDMVEPYIAPNIELKDVVGK